MAADINKQRERHEFRGSGFTCEVCGASFEHDAHKTYQHPDAEPLASKTPRKFSTMAGGPPTGWVVKLGDGRWYRITGVFKDGWATARTTDGRNTKVDVQERDIVEARQNLPTGSSSMDAVSTMAKDSRGRELRHGDRVRTAYGDEGVVDDISGSDIGVDLDLGQYIDVQARELTKMSVAMASDADDLARGSSDDALLKVLRERTAAPDIREAARKEAARRGLGVDKLSALDSARSATCPYCSKTVSMSRGVLGDHRDASGGCLGANRAVARFDTRGRAVFSTNVMMGFNIGDSVKWKRALRASASEDGWTVIDVKNDPRYTDPVYRIRNAAGREEVVIQTDLKK